MKQGEIEIIIPPPRKLDVEAQRQVERLQRHCIVELESIRQIHAWLEDKRHCRQASLCDWRFTDWQDLCL